MSQEPVSADSEKSPDASSYFPSNHMRYTTTMNENRRRNQQQGQLRQRERNEGRKEGKKERKKGRKKERKKGRKNEINKETMISERSVDEHHSRQLFAE